MKTGAAGINSHIQLATTSLATCLKLVLSDSTELGFTDHDVDITYDGLTYEANDNTFDRSAIASKHELQAVDLELDGLLNSNAINASDIRAGKYDGAEVYLFAINWANTASGIIKLLFGTITEIQFEKQMFIAQVKSEAYKLKKNLLHFYTPECKATFGDSDTGCGFDLSTVVQSGTVNVVTDNRNFTTTGLTGLSDDSLNLGKVVWTGGANNGLVNEIKNSTAAGAIELYLKTGFTIANGDTFNVYPGCDKSLTTCRDTYNQIVNFRGTPYIRGNNQQLQVGKGL